MSNNLYVCAQCTTLQLMLVHIIVDLGYISWFCLFWFAQLRICWKILSPPIRHPLPAAVIRAPAPVPCPLRFQVLAATLLLSSFLQISLLHVRNQRPTMTRLSDQLPVACHNQSKASLQDPSAEVLVRCFAVNFRRRDTMATGYS